MIASRWTSTSWTRPVTPLPPSISLVPVKTAGSTCAPYYVVRALPLSKCEVRAEFSGDERAQFERSRGLTVGELRAGTGTSLRGASTRLKLADERIVTQYMVVNGDVSYPDQPGDPASMAGCLRRGSHEPTLPLRTCMC